MDKRFILAQGSSLALTCSGSEETTWEFKRDDIPYFQVDQVQHGKKSYQIVQSSDTTTVLTLWDVSWKHSGVYVCIDRLTGESQEAVVFVPGKSPSYIHINKIVVSCLTALHLLSQTQMCGSSRAPTAWSLKPARRPPSPAWSPTQTSA